MPPWQDWHPSLPMPCHPNFVHNPKQFLPIHRCFASCHLSNRHNHLLHESHRMSCIGCILNNAFVGNFSGQEAGLIGWVLEEVIVSPFIERRSILDGEMLGLAWHKLESPKHWSAGSIINLIHCWNILEVMGIMGNRDDVFMPMRKVSHGRASCSSFNLNGMLGVLMKYSLTGNNIMAICSTITHTQHHNDEGCHKTYLSIHELQHHHSWNQHNPFYILDISKRYFIWF